MRRPHDTCRFSSWADTNTLRCLYLTCIRPHLEYASQLWDPYQTRSGSHMKLVQPLSKHSRDKQFYFNRLPSLWNSLPAIDLTLSYKLIKHRLKVTLWSHFLANFNPESTCSFHYSCPCSKCSTVPRTVFTSL